METEKTILIIGELEEGRLSASTRELLGGGRDLADGLRAGLVLTFLSDQIGREAREAIAYGADRVFRHDRPRVGAVLSQGDSPNENRDKRDPP